MWNADSDQTVRYKLQLFSPRDVFISRLRKLSFTETKPRKAINGRIMYDFTCPSLDAYSGSGISAGNTQNTRNLSTGVPKPLCPGINKPGLLLTPVHYGLNHRR